MKEEKKPKYSDKTPDDELQKMLLTKSRKFNEEGHKNCS